MVKFVIIFFKNLTKGSLVVSNMNVNKFNPGKIRFGRTKSLKLAEMHLVKFINEQKLINN